LNFVSLQQQLSPQGAGHIGVLCLNATTLGLPFNLPADPLAPYNVLREPSPSAFALLARTARAKATLGPDTPPLAPDTVPAFVETWIPCICSSVREFQAPAAGICARGSGRSWSAAIRWPRRFGEPRPKTPKL
jgi:hypothetical protein